jgi:PAS domain S-box-containing protein
MGAERILVVDDDRPLLDLITLAMRRQGYHVDGVDNAQQAVEKLSQDSPYDVLLTDLMMPGMSGQELIRLARQQDPHLEIIVITAAGSLESAIEALREAGAYDYLQKPLESMKALGLVVERAIAHRRLILERDAMRERQLAESQRLQAILAYTGDAILATDGQGTLIVANPAAMQLLGVSELIGRPALECLPLTLANIIADWQMPGSQKTLVAELPWLDGTTQMISLSPLPGVAGEASGWVMVLRDISHLKDLDEYKTRELSEAVRRIQLPLVQAVNAIAELNQLAGQDERVGKIIYQLSNLWRTILQWSDDLNAIVINRLEEEPKLVDVNLAQMLADVKQRMKDTLLSAGIKVNAETLPNVPIARADPRLLRQLLEALIQRARMRSPEGGQVCFNVRIHQEKVWIDISDDGPPIRPADLSHAFERAHVDLTADLTAAGLQLAAAKRLVEQMGGQIFLGGQGPLSNTLSICLPAAK